jgi:hypothetical protein
MEYSCIQLNDLPDEILMIILKKLNNLEVLKKKRRKENFNATRILLFVYNSYIE